MEGHQGKALTGCLTRLYGTRGSNIPLSVTEVPRIDGDRAVQVRTRLSFAAKASCVATTDTRWRARGRYVVVGAVARCGSAGDQKPLAAVMDETLAKMQSLPAD